EETVLLVADPCREIQRAGAPGAGTVAKAQPPQVLDRDGPAPAVRELAEEAAGLWVEGVDVAVAFVADEQVPGELAETGRGQGQPPRRIERPLRDEAPLQHAVRRVHVDEAVARADDVVHPGHVLS